MNAYHKGARAERELARLLSAMFGVEVRRGARPYLLGGPDVYGMAAVHIEVKRRGTFSLPAALRQSVEDSRDGEVPVVMHRPNRCAWIVSVWLADLPALARTVEGLLAGGAFRVLPDGAARVPSQPTPAEHARTDRDIGTQGKDATS